MHAHCATPHGAVPSPELEDMFLLLVACGHLAAGIPQPQGLLALARQPQRAALGVLEEGELATPQDAVPCAPRPAPAPCHPGDTAPPGTPRSPPPLPCLPVGCALGGRLQVVLAAEVALQLDAADAGGQRGWLLWLLPWWPWGW